MTLVFAPGKVGALATYLNYLFLRFPGTLGPETPQEFDCVDTYDRRWSRQHQIWLRRGEEFSRIQPPSLFSLSTEKAEFGLQAPVKVDRVTVSVRDLQFPLGGVASIEGQVVKVRRKSWLVLRSDNEARLTALAATLVAEGLVSQTDEQAWWISDKGPGFLPPPAEVWVDVADARVLVLERLQEAFRIARQYEPGITDDLDTECLHQYRVFLRRARSWASLGRMWAKTAAWSELKETLRKLQQETNHLRDLDVMGLDLPALCSQIPWQQGTYLSGWTDHVARQRRAEFRGVKSWFSSVDYRRLCDQAERLCQELRPAGEPWTVSQLSQDAFGRAAGSLKKALRQVSPTSADETLHQVRILAKRLRYVLDGLGSFVPSARVVLANLKETQEVLGAFQDRSILLASLQAELAAVRDQQTAIDPLAFGLLLGGLIAGQQAQKQQALKAARHLKRKAFFRALAGPL